MFVSAAKFCFEFMGLVFAVFPYRLNKGKARALLSSQLMVSVLVSRHVNRCRGIASGMGF